MLRSTGLGIEFTLPNWVDEVIVSIKNFLFICRLIIIDSISGRLDELFGERRAKSKRM